MTTIEFGPWATYGDASPYLVIRVIDNEQILYQAIMEPIENRFVITKRGRDTTFGRSPILHYKQIFKHKNSEEIEKVVYGQFALAINNMISTLTDLLGLSITAPNLNSSIDTAIWPFIQSSTKFFMR